MAGERIRVESGVTQLDRLLGGLFIGDNVVWHDDAGSLASVFCLNFIQTSHAENKPLIYVSFDRSPKNLLDKLGPLAENRQLTILDCFTYGKGAGSEVFLRFYHQSASLWPCQIETVNNPREVKEVMDALYGIHATMEGDVRFVFESLTGMQELWGGEDHVVEFYSHSCPRLYELNTVAYWIMEKRAHSPRVRARINQIAQVAIDLSVKRGTTFLTILKAEKRNLEAMNQPLRYWSRDLSVRFDDEKRAAGRFDMGVRLKELRTKRGISQTELASLVGVTPSTISQVESNLIYPSVTALIRMAEVLSVKIGTIFQERPDETDRVIFSPAEAVEVKFPDLPSDGIRGLLLTPLDNEPKAEPYLLEIPPETTLPSHFFIHKGEEMGYLLTGTLHLKMSKTVHTAKAGDLIYMSLERPSQWKNPEVEPAKLLWFKIK